MSGRVVQDGERWLWRSDGRADLLLRHNEWAKTSDREDMPRLNAPLANLDAVEAEARSALADRYFALWQDSWRRDGDEDLSRDAFMQALSLTSVSYPSAQHLHSHFDLSFDDAGLFAGHAFFVTVSLKGDVQGVEMFG